MLYDAHSDEDTALHAKLGAVSALAGLVEKGLVAPDWAEALAPVEDDIARMGAFLRAEIAAGRGYLPAGDHILRAFQRPLADVKVLIVGQDPYPTPGHPVGLCFSVAPDVRPLPPSLVNIFRELVDDLGVPPPTCGDLTPWADAGVLLLNRSLTVCPGRANSHRGKGWEPVTDRAITALADRGGPLAAILWGSDAQGLRPGSVRSRGWSRRTRARSPPIAASSAPGRSAGSTGCSRSRAGPRWTGALP